MIWTLDLEKFLDIASFRSTFPKGSSRNWVHRYCLRIWTEDDNILFSLSSAQKPVLVAADPLKKLICWPLGAPGQVFCVYRNTIYSKNEVMLLGY